MLTEGHEVSVLDEDPEAIAQLEKGETDLGGAGGSFTVGTALEIDALLEAGIDRADAFVASTDGDNTNLVIAQVAQRRFEVPNVVVRVLDPARAAWYERAGPRDRLPHPDRDRAARGRGPGGRRLMYVIVVGAGKVGWNLARELIDKGNELTVVEADRRRFATVEEELEHAVQYGDGSELWVLERAGIERADLVIAVTGDDEDNILICQVAREKYGVERVIARCNNPRNLQHFELLGVKPAVSATDLILRLIEHEVPKVGLLHLLDLPQERLEIIELEVPRRLAAPRASRCKELGMPDGSLVISILRDGTGFVPLADSVVEEGDEVLLVLDTGLEDKITALLRAADGLSAPPAVADRAVDFLLIGGGVAVGGVRAHAARGGRRGLDPGRGARGRRAVRAAAAVEELPARARRARGRVPRRRTGAEQNDVELARAHERDEARHRGARRRSCRRRRRWRFGKALIATGANVRRLRVDGSDLDGIHYLRAFGERRRDPRGRARRPSAWC